jgi:hypothetical protein
MPIQKKYFHDKLVLLLLSVMGFLTILGSLLTLFQLDNARDSYIIQYRSNLGLDAYKTGGTGAVLSFIAFSFLVTIINIVISIRVYHVRKELSFTVLSLGILLQIITMFVSNALLLVSR